MARPTRRHPLIRLHRSPEAISLIEQVAGVLGAFQYRAVDQVGNITVFRLDGPLGSGLLADRPSGLVQDQPGVLTTQVSSWVRAALHAESFVFDATLHSWDAATEAEVTGDRSIVDGPTRVRYRVRDERSAEAATADSLMVSEIPADAVPAFVAGLPARRVRDLATAHAPELLV